MFFPVVICCTLAVMWGAMYHVGGNPLMLFSSGLAAGGAIVLATFGVMDNRYRQ
jgi:hypothetical protein